MEDLIKLRNEAEENVKLSYGDNYAMGYWYGKRDAYAELIKAEEPEFEPEAGPASAIYWNSPTDYDLTKVPVASKYKN